MSQISTPPPLSTYGGDRPRSGGRPSKVPWFLAALLLIAIAMLSVLLVRTASLQKDVNRMEAGVQEISSMLAKRETTSAPPDTTASTAPVTQPPASQAASVSAPGTTK